MFILKAYAIIGILVGCWMVFSMHSYAKAGDEQAQEAIGELFGNFLMFLGFVIWVIIGWPMILLEIIKAQE